MDLTIRIDAKIEWQAKALPSGRWIGVCDPLGVTVEAVDQAELRSVIEETHYTLFLDLLEDGELERFLRDRGWEARVPIPSGVPTGGVNFEVPFEVVQAAMHGRP